MKQEITQSQYEELTDEQRQKYIAWTLKPGHYTESFRSIGHLIWFLDENGKNWKGFQISRDMEEDDEGVLVKVGWSVSVSYGEIHKDGNELVDVLWECVKQILEA